MPNPSGPSLAELACAIRRIIQESDGRVHPPGEVRLLAPAHFFEHNVTQGGFAQLIFNAQGECLGEIEDMLRAAGATVAARYYEQAVEVCVADAAEYQRFLASDYLSSNGIKDALHEVSIAYFQEGRDFEVEAGAFLAGLKPRVGRWLAEQGPSDA